MKNTGRKKERPLFTDDMIVYIGKKNYTYVINLAILLEINIVQNQLCPHKSNQQLEVL